MMTVSEASLYCVYNPGWNGGDDCEVRRHCTVCTTLGGMVMTERGVTVLCVQGAGWNGDDCERGVTVLCVQP